MINKIIFITILIWVSAFAKAQTDPIILPVKTDSTKTPEYFFIDGDSLSAIELDRVMLLQSLKFDSRYENIRYQIIKRKVKKVWPYAKLAAERLTELDRRLASLEYESDKKKYTKIVQRYVEEEFTTELKKLTTTEGQILIKLLHRQTGMTTFELLKQLRSGWSAFWFKNAASIFDIDLKAEYLPESNIEDFYIEDVLLNEFKNETLDEQEPALSYDYFKGRTAWNTYEDNLPADYDSIQLAERARIRKEYLKKKAKENDKKRRKLERKRRRASKR
ncbi:hypothetical protein BBFL7_00193 [Flavobacteria bacterium BBFL7]|nr:hypothetical protein BBFL7_00193 [Flavobacteria bacterium BBFL7]